MMDKPKAAAVEIVEVGPRDGFQGIGPFIPTETKIEHPGAARRRRPASDRDRLVRERHRRAAAARHARSS